MSLPLGILAVVKMTEAVRDLAQSQDGVVSRAQLIGCGVPRRTVDRLPDSNWTQLHPAVFVAAGVPETWERRLWAARLAVGDPTAVSHEAAGRILGFRTFDRSDVVALSAPRGDHHRIEGAVVHQIGDLFAFPDQIVAMSSGLPVTSPARTFVDLSAVLRPGRLAYTLEDAITAKKVSVEAVSETLFRVARKGKPGVRKLLRALSAYTPGEPIPGSHLERRLLALLRAAGEPLPALQVPLPGRGGAAGLVDFCYLASKVILEVDGRRWHARVSQLKKDHDRDAQAAAAGYVTLRLMHEHVVGDPTGTVRLVRTTRMTREAQLAA